MEKSTRTTLHMQQQPGLPHLPDAAVICILSHIPLKQRLQLALTCQSWAAAAVMASTSSTHVTLSQSPARANKKGFELWLERCADLIHHLTACSSLDGEFGMKAKAFLQLPCHKLTQLVSLSLQDVSLDMRLPSTSTRTGKKGLNAVNSSSRSKHGAINQHAAAGLLPCLQKLELVNCDVLMHQMEQLSCSSSLTCLTLQQVRLCPNSKTIDMKSRRAFFDARRLRKAFTPLLTSVPPGLASLSLDKEEYVSLWLSKNSSRTEPSSAPSSMQRLQHLTLRNIDMAPVFELLPASLTALELHRCSGMYAIPKESTAQLGNLERLHLEDLSLAPSLLLGFPLLQHLVLRSVMPLVFLATADSNSVLTSVMNASKQRRPNLHGMLSAIGQMTQLQHLEWITSSSDEYASFQGVPVNMFTALTASTQLTALRMEAAARPTYRQFQAEPLALPQGAWKHMLPTGKVMPQLRVLQLAGAVCKALPPSKFGNTHRQVAATGGAAVDDSHRMLTASARIDAATIGRISRSCPALQEATLHYVLQDAAAVNSLAQLSTLTSLSIAGHVCDDEAAAAVARLIRLRSLRWERSRCRDVHASVTVSGLLHLRLCVR